MREITKWRGGGEEEGEREREKREINGYGEWEESEIKRSGMEGK